MNGANGPGSGPLLVRSGRGDPRLGTGSRPPSPCGCCASPTAPWSPPGASGSASCAVRGRPHPGHGGPVGGGGRARGLRRRRATTSPSRAHARAGTPTSSCSTHAPCGGCWETAAGTSIDMHEEPFGLAVAEVLVLRCAAGPPHARILVCSAQNLDKRYPPPFRWFERLVAAACGRRLHLQHRGGSDPAAQGPDRRARAAAARRRHRPVPAGRPSATRRSPAGRLRRPADPGQGGRRPAPGRRPRRPARPRRLRRRSGGRRARGPGRRTRRRPVGSPSTATWTSPPWPGVVPTFDVLAVPSVPDPSWLEQFGRVVVEGAGVRRAGGGQRLRRPARRGRAARAARAAGATRSALAAALARLLDEPGLW